MKFIGECPFSPLFSFLRLDASRGVVVASAEINPTLNHVGNKKNKRKGKYSNVSAPCGDVAAYVICQKEGTSREQQPNGRQIVGLYGHSLGASSIAIYQLTCESTELVTY